MEIDQQKYIEQNRAEYAEIYDSLKRLTPDGIAAAESQRAALLEALNGRVKWDFRDSKADCSQLSPGCRLCGEGLWSCLFINDRCNARCFYCPARQDGNDTPGTSSLEFPNPEDYADYIEKFGFKGVSISGGEPFLAFEKAFDFVRILKKRFGSDIHLWLYTNGILADIEKLHRLADAGLDEIRFDLSAVNYDLSKVRMASGSIPIVTVEIPAIPEDLEFMQSFLPRLEEAGVNFLNLHQIRMTNFNAANLMRRGYTILHGPKMTVLETEITALEILRYARENGIALPINYCSFIYRNRFQTRAARSCYAPFIKKNHEEVTGAGLIRTMSTEVEPSKISRLIGLLQANNISANGPYATQSNTKMYFNEEALKVLLPELDNLQLAYHVPMLRPSISYRHTYKEIELNKRKKIVIERKSALHGVILAASEIPVFYDEFILGKPSPLDLTHHIENSSDSAAIVERWKDIYFYEKIKSGLYEYY